MIANIFYKTVLNLHHVMSSTNYIPNTFCLLRFLYLLHSFSKPFYLKHVLSPNKLCLQNVISSTSCASNMLCPQQVLSPNIFCLQHVFSPQNFLSPTISVSIMFCLQNIYSTCCVSNMFYSIKLCLKYVLTPSLFISINFCL